MTSSPTPVLPGGYGIVTYPPGTIKITLVIPPEQREPENPTELDAVLELANTNGWLIEVHES